MNPNAQDSIRHHYIPVFYLKRWVGDDAKICQYSRPRDDLHVKRVYPVQTGFVDRLYEMKGVPPDAAQQIEHEFMKPVDTFASQALEMLENGDNRINTPKYRSAWSLFIMTLLMRMPEDLEVLEAALAEEWQRELPALRKLYKAKRRPIDPATIEEFIEQSDPQHMSRWTLNVARSLMDHDQLGQLLNNMRWFVVTAENPMVRLLTSDRPVVMSASLTERHAYLFVPLGPTRLFVAVNNVETENIVRARPINQMIESCNDVISGHAIKYVYGTDDSHFDFVNEHISKRKLPSLMERLRRLRNSREPGWRRLWRTVWAAVTTFRAR